VSGGTRLWGRGESNSSAESVGRFGTDGNHSLCGWTKPISLSKHEHRKLPRKSALSAIARCHGREMHSSRAFIRPAFRPIRDLLLQQRYTAGEVQRMISRYCNEPDE
jgi:hypothetical protein